MAVFLRLIAEWLWPSVRLPTRERYLKLLLIAIIGMWAGPDIFAFMEMTTVLEILGTTIFLLTFAVGFRALGLALFERLRDYLMPVEYWLLLTLDRRLSAKTGAILLIGRRAMPVACFCIVAYTLIRDFAPMVI